jgi:DNA-binding PadR family transcriptional regulator
MLRLKDSLTYGNIWLAVAAVLQKEKKAYAYTLPGKIERRFGFSPNKIMTYLVLYKLEDEGLIKSHFEDRRKYYVLTHKGKNARAEGKRLLAQMSKDV